MMNWREQAPAKGTIYALLRTEVVFKIYENLYEVKSYMESPQLLEVHLFDKEKEYRKVSTRAGFKELVIMDPEEKNENQDVYEEKIFVLSANADETEDFENQVTVVNYITYNQDDMITITNYRLKEVK